MKYYITINQLVLSKTDLDVVDAAILDYIYFYCNSQNEKVKKQRITDEDNETWSWIDYQSLLKDMPLLKINSISAISHRIEKIEKSGYIKTKRFYHKKKYFQMSSHSDELFMQMNKAIHLEEQRYSSRRTDAIHLEELIKNKDNKDKRNKELTSALTECNAIYTLYSEKINSKSRLTNSARKKIEIRLKEYSPENLKRAIMNFSRATWWMTHNAHRGVAWFFHTEDRIDQFLNLEPEDKKEKLNL